MRFRIETRVSEERVMKLLLYALPAIVVLAVMHPATRRFFEGFRETRTMTVRNGQQVNRGLARLIRF